MNAPPTSTGRTSIEKRIALGFVGALLILAAIDASAMQTRPVRDMGYRTSALRPAYAWVLKLMLTLIGSFRRLREKSTRISIYGPRNPSG